jgi:acyl-CoA synthetase (AMP-forming)/AMP-acid ligase II
MNIEPNANERPLSTLLAEAAARYSEAAAVCAGGVTHSYGQLEADSERVARSLVHAGVRPGDRVALFMPNCVEFVLAYFGCFKAGALAVPLNTRYRWPEARYAIEHSGATTLLAHSALAGEVDVRALDGLGVVRRHLAGPGRPADSFRPFGELLAAGDTSVRLPLVLPDQDALLLYTSGSTAKPKGVTLTHAGVRHTLRAYAAMWELTGTDRVLVSLPICHAAGLMCELLTTLATGGQSFLLPVFDPEATLRAIEEHRITWTLVLPPQLGALAEQAARADGRHDLTSLRFAIVGGDKAPLPTLERFRAALGFEATEGCGITECVPYASNRPFGARRTGSIGVPAPDTELRIDGAARAGDEGEILLRSPSMMRGYWRDSGATSQALRDGWLHTGDLGYVDEDGYVWWTGRSKFIIVRGGSNISPLEVEEVLDGHPAVQQSAVVGVPDEKLGQRVVAYAVTREGLDSPSGEELRSFVAERLAAYKVPEVMFLATSLPISGMGKVDRSALQRRAALDLASPAPAAS